MANEIGQLNLNRGDSYGKAFAEANDPLLSQLLDGLKAAAAVFSDTADSSEAMVHNFVATEDNNTDTAAGLFNSSPPQ